MCSFKILVLLLTCVLVTVTTNGRTVEHKAVVSEKRTTWKVYLQDNASRMVLTTEKNGKISDCYISGDNYVIAIALQTISRSKIIKLDKKTMNSVTQYCTYAKWRHTLGSNGQDMYQELGLVSAMLIYPGTKWCGAGNVSESHDDLGPEVETDLCCREHDYCDDSIEAFESKYGLDNNSPFTKSNCKCDKIFFECLREADTRSSNRVGIIYFNYIRMECFKLEHPIRGCNRYKGLMRPRCVDYNLDKEQEPIWQFFDAKEYRPVSEEGGLKLSKQDVFEFMLSSSPSSSQICNPTKNVENKTWISSYLMNLTPKKRSV